MKAMLLKILKRYTKLRESWPSRILLPVIGIAPPLIVALANCKWALKIPFFSNLPPFFERYPTLAVACIGWAAFVAFVAPIDADIRSFVKSAPSLDAGLMHSLLAALDHIVGVKSRTLATHARQKEEADDHFDPVRQAQDQINSLAHGVYLVFRDRIVPDDDSLRVTLARMGKNHIKDFLCYLPSNHQPLSSVQSLQTQHSCFSKTKKTKKIFIIEDIASALRKNPNAYVGGNGDEPAEGSIICFPVRSQGSQEVPYVISVKTRRKNGFKKALLSRYSFVLERFALRISLEHTNIRLAKDRDANNTAAKKNQSRANG